MKLSEIWHTDKDNMFKQHLIVDYTNIHSWGYCKNLCMEDSVILHVGCSDYPFNDVKLTMHFYLSERFNNLVGYDINGIEQMQKECSGKYFESLNDIIKSKTVFDVILIPNVIEHIPNPKAFVDEIFKIKFNTLFCLVPTFFILEQSHLNGNRRFIEMVHPDHVCWYSPYTLLNLFREQIEKHNADCELTFFDNKNMIGLTIKV